MSPLNHMQDAGLEPNPPRRPPSGPQPHIRAATPDDAPAIARLHASSWQRAYRGMLTDTYLAGPIEADRLALWSRRLAVPEPGQAVWVAEAGAQLVGLACGFAAAHPQWGTLLENLHVAASHQRQGIGAALVATVQAWARAQSPAERVHLWVLAGNLPAQHFYARLGAQPVAQGTWDAPDGSSLAQQCLAWA